MIKNISIKNLYGKNFNVSFNEDLTILYGLNGSGKTTILNIISSFFQGQIQSICSYQFDSLEINYFKDNSIKKFNIVLANGEYLISLNDIKYSIKEIDEDLDVLLNRKNLEDLEEIDYNENILEKYNHYKKFDVKWITKRKEQKRSERKIEEELKEISEFVYVPLNRKVIGLDKFFSTSLYSHRGRGEDSNKKNIEDTLKKSEVYFESYQNLISRTASVINSKLKKEILQELSTPMDSKHMVKIMLQKDNPFTEVEKNLLTSIDEDVKGNIHKLLKLYRDTMDSYQLSAKYEIEIIDPIDFLIHSTTMGQLSKLKKVAESKDYQDRIEYLERQKNNLEYMLEVINHLFKDTEKSIIYSYNREGSKEILNFKHFTSKEKLDLSLLSSGEKQVIIFFIFSLIELHKNKQKILLIDEPEISLHVEWQSKLLPLIMKKRDKKQIIIATHSPDVIGEFVNKCEEIKGE